MILTHDVPISLQIDWLKDDLERRWPTDPLTPEHFDQGYFVPDLSDRGQRRYEEGGWQVGVAAALMEHFKSMAIFELGCGIGHTLNRLREKGCEVGGLDVSKWATEKAQEIYNLSVIEGDLRNLPELPGWKVMYIHNTLCYLTLSELEHALDEIRTKCVDMEFLVARVNCASVIAGIPPSIKGRRLVRSYEWWQWKIMERWYNIDENCDRLMRCLGPALGYPVVARPMR